MGKKFGFKSLLTKPSVGGDGDGDGAAAAAAEDEPAAEHEEEDGNKEEDGLGLGFDNDDDEEQPRTEPKRNTKKKKKKQKDDEERTQLFGGSGGGKRKTKTKSKTKSKTKTKSKSMRSIVTKESEEAIESKLVGSDREEAVEDGKDDNDNDEEEEDGTKEEEEDVHKMLEDMEIPDFDMSMSFDEDEEGNDNDKGNGNDKDNAKAAGPSNQDNTLDNNVDYERRLRREEVFSKRYHPSKSERNELQAVAKHLGVASSGFRLTTCQATLHQLLFGNHSVVLKKGGPVRFNHHKDCDLILLTDGFLVVHRNFNAYNPLERRYETCRSWSDVEFVELGEVGNALLTIQMRSPSSSSSGGESLHIRCREEDDGERPESWFQTIERIVVLSAVHGAPSTMATETDTETDTDLEVFGWQYTLVRKPAYTTAVTGNLSWMGNPGPNHLNQLDAYHQSAPLHYALQQEPCRADVIDALLRAGADPNLADGEGRSAMYYAQRNRFANEPTIEAILKEAGGRPSQLADTELRGELFAGVDEAAKNSEQRREREQTLRDRKAAEAAAKTRSAQSQMSENMAAMIERGETIDAIDDKAQQLNDEAKQYRSLATQLKNQMKSKKWYQL
mmetsp:Transcript_20133/g.42606  ORF Transcript_20133/g.42606 Transcript_20133/m.42606 type:complete len:615 (+) Transcript_20133:178-2022(+)